MGPGFKGLVLAVVVAAIVIGVKAGQSQSQTSAQAPPAFPVQATLPAAGPGQVFIVTNNDPDVPGRYSPDVLKVRVGDTVRFANKSNTDHTATSENGAFNTDVLSPGDSKTWKPTKPGKYLYGCYIHPSMHGEIDVSP